MLKDIPAGLRSFLLADSAISTAVGGARIHGVKLPVGAMPGPSIVYNQISEDTDHVMTGSSGLVRSRYQIDAWASTFDAARNLGLLIKERLDGYRGAMGSGANLVNVQSVLAANANPEYDSGSNLYRQSRDYFITYDER